MIVAVIPARGGSKRLKRKNVLPFCGHPLIAYAIALARRAPSISRCIVTTEDLEIAEVARREGAEVVDRPVELAGDSTPTADAILHAVEHMRDRATVTGVATLQPTNPLRPVDVLERAIKRFEKEPCDSLISVSRRKLKVGEVVDGYFRPGYRMGAASIEIPPTFVVNGLFYLTKIDTLISRRQLCGERILAFETDPPFDQVDIDDETDFMVGECIYEKTKHLLGY